MYVPSTSELMSSIAKICGADPALATQMRNRLDIPPMDRTSGNQPIWESSSWSYRLETHVHARRHRTGGGGRILDSSIELRCTEPSDPRKPCGYLTTPLKPVFPAPPNVDRKLFLCLTEVFLTLARFWQTEGV